MEGAIGEDEPFHSDRVPAPPALYGASKVIGEQLCHLYRARQTSTSSRCVSREASLLAHQLAHHLVIHLMRSL